MRPQTIRMEDKVQVKGYSGDWIVQLIQGPFENYCQGLYGDFVKYGEPILVSEKQNYMFTLSPDWNVPDEDKARFLGYDWWELLADPVLMEEFDENIQATDLKAEGQDIIPSLDTEDMLYIGDEVTWRQSLPQKHIIKPLHNFYIIDNFDTFYEDKDFAMNNSSLYWQAYGPVRTGRVRNFRTAWGNQNLHAAYKVPWSEVHAGDWIVEVDPNEALPEEDPAYITLFKSEDIDSADALLRESQRRLDIAYYTEDEPSFKKDWANRSGVGTELIAGGYLRTVPTATAGQYVWKKRDGSLTPPEVGGIAPDRPPGPPATPTIDRAEKVIHPELIGEIVPSEEEVDIIVPEDEVDMIVPPLESQIVPPMDEEELIVPDDREELIVPDDDDDIPPESPAPPLERKKREKKKKKKLEEELAA